jgi:hypothetical protein
MKWYFSLHFIYFINLFAFHILYVYSLFPSKILLYCVYYKIFYFEDNNKETRYSRDYIYENLYTYNRNFVLE